MATRPKKSPPDSHKTPAAKRASVKKASRSVDEKIRSVVDWRADVFAAIRGLIEEADPEIVEERKWIKPGNPLGVPVWSHAGIVCTGETYKQVVKLTFARGASLEDGSRLFNASLEGSTRRAIDIREGDAIDTRAFKALVQSAVAENVRVSASKGRVRR